MDVISEEAPPQSAEPQKKSGWIGAIAVFAIVIAIAIFATRTSAPKNLTEEMLSSSIIVDAIIDKTTEEVDSGLNDFLWNVADYYICDIDAHVTEMVTSHPTTYEIGERSKVSKDSTDYFYATVLSKIAHDGDSVYRYDFRFPVTLTLTLTDENSEWMEEEYVQVCGHILWAKLGFSVRVDDIIYSEDMQDAFDLAETFGWVSN